MSVAIKQVIVMRKDLGMRKGKMIAQGAHASMKVLLDKGSVVDGTLTVPLDSDEAYWVQHMFAKITVYVNSEDELMEVYDAAKSAGLSCALITDQGHTEFHGVPTKTCIAIGPTKAEDIDKVTGHLPLL